MNATPLRQLFLASIALAAVHCAPADGAATADLPEEAESALAQTYSFDASDCWGSITYCPGSTTMIESCYLGTGAGSDGAGGAAHRVHTYDPGNSTWHWTQCANGSTIQMYCQGPGQQTVASCTTEFGPGASYGIVGTRRHYSPTTGLGTLMQNNGLESTVGELAAIRAAGPGLHERDVAPVAARRADDPEVEAVDRAVDDAEVRGQEPRIT
jgi:hypothetical protein